MRKLKSIFVMIIILSLLLAGTILGIVITNKNKKPEEVIEEVEEIETIPTTFLGDIKYDYYVSGKVADEVIDLIVAYNDAYYLSMYTLEQVSTAQYFSSDIAGAISDDAIKLIVESRKLYDFDLSLSNAHYDITFTDYYFDGDDTYYVDFLIDEYMNFAFLGDISSEAYDVENSMTIKLINNELKIDDYDKTQGYYMMFYDNRYTCIKDVDDVYEYYFKQIKKEFDNENYLKSQASNTTYLASKSYDVAYDRQKAVAYADKYYAARNDDWYDFSNEGGNCQNYASQCLIAGGMLMDYYGEDEWYYQSPEVEDRTTSWVLVPGFYEYCQYNEGSGLVADVDVNMFYAEPGDIVQVGISSVTHSTVVSKVIDGHILLNSNSIDMVNWPIEAYTYPTKKLIKIIGSNY